MSAAKALLPTMASVHSALQNAFEECCLVGVDFDIRYQAAAGFEFGMIVVGVDQDDATVPTSSILNSPHLEISAAASTANQIYRVKWIPQDLKDLDWESTSSTTATAWLKFYADPSFTLTTAANVGRLIISGTIAVDYRQFKE